MSSVSMQKTIPVIGVPPQMAPEPEKPAPKLENEQKKAPLLPTPGPPKPVKQKQEKKPKLPQTGALAGLTQDEITAYNLFLQQNTALLIRNTPGYEQLPSKEKNKHRRELRHQFLSKKEERMREYHSMCTQRLNDPNINENKKKKLTTFLENNPHLKESKIERRKRAKAIKKGIVPGIKPPRPKKKKEKQPTVPLMSKMIDPPMQMEPITAINNFAPSDPLGYSEYSGNGIAPAPVQAYQYLQENWLNSQWEGGVQSTSYYSQAPTSSMFSISAPSSQQQPESSHYNTLMPELASGQANRMTTTSPPVTGHFSAQIDQTSQYKPQPQQSEYHKMFLSSTSSAPTVPIPSESSAEFEAAVAMQKRLLQIDKELQEIERQKVEMAMADELRRKEAELKEKERMLQKREYEFKRREEKMRRRHRSRSRSRERDSYRETMGRHEYHRSSRPDHHHHHHHHQPDSYLPPTHHHHYPHPPVYQPPPVPYYEATAFASSHIRGEIRIEMRDRLREERDAEAARRHGQRRSTTRRDQPSPGGEERRDSSRRQANSYSSGASSRHGALKTEDVSDDDNWG